jgi:hypothetical protein
MLEFPGFNPTPHGLPMITFVHLGASQDVKELVEGYLMWSLNTRGSLLFHLIFSRKDDTCQFFNLQRAWCSLFEGLLRLWISWDAV